MFDHLVNKFKSLNLVRDRPPIPRALSPRGKLNQFHIHVNLVSNNMLESQHTYLCPFSIDYKKLFLIWTIN